MARRRRDFRNILHGMLGSFEIETCDELMALHDRLMTSGNPSHAPESRESALLRFAIVQTVERLQAREPDRQRESIVAEVMKRLDVKGRSTVFDAFKFVGPQLLAIIRERAAEDAKRDRMLTALADVST